MSLPQAGTLYSTNEQISLPGLLPNLPSVGSASCEQPETLEPLCTPVSEHLRLVSPGEDAQGVVLVCVCSMRAPSLTVSRAFILLNSCEVSLTSALSSQLSIWTLGHVIDGPGRDSHSGLSDLKAQLRM